MPIRAHEASFSYRGRTPALSGITFEPQPGRVTAIVGPNGSGKSTLIRLLLGSLAPCSGRVLLGNTPTHKLPPRARARSIGYIAQRPDAAFAYPVRQVVELGRIALGCSASDDRKAVDRALNLVGLSDLADLPLTQLSVGQQQRVAIARAIAQLDQPVASSKQAYPRILLADEPIAALDPAHATSTLQLFRSLANDGLAVVVVLHDLLAALRNADDALLLAQGRVIASSNAPSVLTPEVLSPVFGVGFTMPMQGILIPL